MSEKMEKYLKDQRPSLDVETPDDHAIWEGIRDGLSRNTNPKSSLWIRMRNIAAILLIGLGVGYAVNDLVNKRRYEKGIRLVKIDKRLGEKEDQYRQLISMKEKEAGIGKESGNIMVGIILDEIEKLDAVYEQCMKDLKEMGYDDRVINTIFDTYEKKIYLLELIILEKNKMKRYENKKEIRL